MNKLKIDIPLYEAVCSIYIEEDISEYIRIFGKKKKWKEDLTLHKDDKVEGYAVPLGNNRNYLLFFEKTRMTPNTISHEISHLVDFILEERGIELTGEARAYLTGHISGKIYEYAHKHNLIIWPKTKSIKPKIKEDEIKPS